MINYVILSLFIFVIIGPMLFILEDKLRLASNRHLSHYLHENFNKELVLFFLLGFVVFINIYLYFVLFVFLFTFFYKKSDSWLSKNLFFNYSNKSLSFILLYFYLFFIVLSFYNLNLDYLRNSHNSFTLYFILFYFFIGLSFLIKNAVFFMYLVLIFVLVAKINVNLFLFMFILVLTGLLFLLKRGYVKFSFFEKWVIVFNIIVILILIW